MTGPAMTRPAVTAWRLPLRPELAGQVSYGAPQLDVPVRLITNENAYPPSPGVFAEVVAAVSTASAGLIRNTA